jgi:hypothetical protein
MYNTTAPSGMRAYWRREDEQKELSDLAKRVLRHYIIWSKGEGASARAKALREAAEWAGFEVEAVEFRDETGEVKWKYADDDFEKFQGQIKRIGRGKFEYEVNEIADIMQEWKAINYAKLSLFSRIKIWLRI